MATKTPSTTPRRSTKTSTKTSTKSSTKTPVLTAPPGRAISGFSHVTGSVTDLERARHFYCDVLGFEVLPRPEFDGFPGLWLRMGNLQLHLGVIDAMPERKGFPHIALYVPTDEIPATFDRLRDAGVNVMREPRSREDFGRTVWAGFVCDPDGNAIELTDVAAL